ncbi:winged helix-turn-helix domain-containing tetratricopeptide repeat protein [Rubrivivax sp. A210]|uniref:winged helix-turn-helix domain-containing tetratricopeptide repeat protein n=1 Tax=Rubrivivax sp. A210 TaxID=2772301 RepID=UPI00191A9015|nr:winged helix-turn-helix domain-containing protein [Rubrivivax sp. A210]
MAHLPRYPLADRFSVGPWQVHTSRDEVAGLGQVHKLEPRAMRLLTVLAQAGGEVVPPDRLLEAVWPGLIVTPSSLYDAVALLRKVLGADHIATVPRKGYRLATAVTPEAAPAMAARTSILPAEAAEPRLGPRSVAVLPFVMRGLPEPLSFLSESLTGALISELSRQPGLVVVALGTMLTFGQRHPPPQQLARDLGVRYVVDGQLEQHGDMLHVGVQVVDGRRGTQTWADELTLPTHAWHATAQGVAGRLARALRFELNDLASQEAALAASDAQVQARAFAAQAWVQLFARAQTPDTNQRATRLARSAVALAPELSQGWMCLAYADWRAGHYRWSDEPRDEQLARALAEAERAVAIDPRDPDAHYVLSLAARHFRGQRQRADEALRHCLRLSSSYAPAYGLLAQSLERQGRHDEARAHCDKAFGLSPLEPLRVIWHFVRAEAHLTTGDPQAALQEAQRGMAVNPSYGQLYMVGAVAAWRLGALEQAHEWVIALRQHPAFCSLQAVRVTLARSFDPACIGQLEQLLDTLGEAGLPQQ